MSFLRSIRGKKQDPADEVLARAYQEDGDLQALADLYERYMDLVYGLCLKYLEEPEVARDAVMVVFEVLVRDMPRAQPIRFFKSWLYTVARHHCLMQLRSAGKGKVVELGEVMQSPEELHLKEEEEEDFLGLEQCMEALPEEQRRVIHLFYREEKCYQEIAALTGQEWNKVRSHIQNGRRNLKLCMEKRAHVQKGV